jgi:acyl-CoA thioester hydrolase
MRITADPPLDPDAYVFRHDLRVRFAETDAMGIVHHASYLPYLEAARVEYLRSIGHDYVSVRAAGVNFAVIEVALKYLRPCHFDDLVTVHLKLWARTRATFQMAYLLTVDGAPRVTAVTAHGCVDADGRPTRMPRWLADDVFVI